MLRKALDDQNLEASLCGAIGGEYDISSTDPSVRQNGINFLNDYSDLSDEDRKAEWDRSADSLKSIGDHAAKNGVVIALEPINRFEIDMINTAEQGCRMCDQVANPSIKLMLDSFHMNI